MAIKRTIWCDECGIELTDEESAKSHEDKNCVPWNIGDRVNFPYNLMTFPGTITRFGDPVGPGETRIAYIRADEQIGEQDLMAAITGCDFYASVNKLQAL